MKKMKRMLILATLLFVAVAGRANATVIFSDDFNSENGGNGALNYNSFTNWTVTSGTVDLIGNGFHDFLPGNGLYVDLDGSTLNAGILLSKEIMIADAGNYVFSFDMAGSQRGSNEMVHVQVNAGNYQQLFSIGSLQGFTQYSTIFQADAPGLFAIQLRFANAGGDNIGALLDNVKVANAAPVPEPSTLLLLGSGIAGLGFWRMRKGKV